MEWDAMNETLLWIGFVCVLVNLKSRFLQRKRFESAIPVWERQVKFAWTNKKARTTLRSGVKLEFKVTPIPIVRKSDDSGWATDIPSVHASGYWDDEDWIRTAVEEHADVELVDVSMAAHFRRVISRDMEDNGHALEGGIE